MCLCTASFFSVKKTRVKKRRKSQLPRIVAGPLGYRSTKTQDQDTAIDCFHEFTLHCLPSPICRHLVAQIL
jgi:hypothetical protein